MNNLKKRTLEERDYRVIWGVSLLFLLILATISYNQFSLVADVREQGPVDSEPSGLLAGVARADISPPIGIPIQNWGAQTHIEAVGIHYPIVANALVLSDGTQEFCMIDYDAVITTSSAAVMRKKIEEKTGIPYSHIRIAVSHTHAAPWLKRSHTHASKYVEAFKRWEDGVVEKIVGIAWRAQQNLQPAHLGAGKGECSININRRYRANGDQPEGVGLNPDGFVDRDVVVARIDDAGGNPFAIIVNYQCHGTVLAWENKYVSPDFPGFVRKAVEEALPGTICLFFNGAAGNLAPMEGFSGDLRVPERLGSILGFRAASIALGIETVDRKPVFEGYTESTAFLVRQPWRVQSPKSGKIKFTEKLLTLPRRRVKDIEQLAVQVQDAEDKLKAAENSNDSWNLSQAKARHKRLSDRLAQWKKWQTAGPLTTTIHAVRVGELAFFCMSGEPFAEIGAEIKKNSPFEFTMFCAYSHADGTSGWVYMPTAEEYDLNGYEVFGSPYGRESAGIVVKEAGELLNKVSE